MTFKAEFEHQVEDAADAAFFVANEVINEYHAFPVVQRADLGKYCMYMLINEKWYQVSFANVIDPDDIEKLEELAG